VLDHQYRNEFLRVRARGETQEQSLAIQATVSISALLKMRSSEHETNASGHSTPEPTQSKIVLDGSCDAMRCVNRAPHLVEVCIVRGEGFIYYSRASTHLCIDLLRFVSSRLAWHSLRPVSGVLQVVRIAAHARGPER
jgi:hypothetical protein